MNRPYVLSRGAAADLRDIARYTLVKWGARQCQAYIAALEDKATSLALGQGVFKDMGEVLPGLRVAACGKHFIFCMPQSNGPAIILAILHERRDMIARLKARLKQ